MSIFTSITPKFANKIAYWLGRRTPWALSKMGGTLGRLMLLSPKMRRRLNENLVQAGFADSVTAKAVAANIGRMAVETAALWATSDKIALGRIKQIVGWDAVLSAKEAGQGIIFLTPHMGTFEYASLFIASQMPLTAMFRPPRVTWAEPMMRAGRERLQMKSVPAEMSGIRAMLKALRSGETVGLLPDQTPDFSKGAEGVWAHYFGRPAFTMTLLHKLAKATSAQVVMVGCVRLKDAAGYRLMFTPLPPFDSDATRAAEVLNTSVETMIRSAPEQYLWSYNRYKVPAGSSLLPGAPV